MRGAKLEPQFQKFRQLKNRASATGKDQSWVMVEGKVKCGENKQVPKKKKKMEKPETKTKTQTKNKNKNKTETISTCPFCYKTIPDDEAKETKLGLNTPCPICMDDKEARDCLTHMLRNKSDIGCTNCKASIVVASLRKPVCREFIKPRFATSDQPKDGN